MREKSYSELSVKAKKGIDKFTTLSARDMRICTDVYKNRTGKNPYAISNKDHFYSWLSDYKI